MRALNARGSVDQVYQDQMPAPSGRNALDEARDRVLGLTPLLYSDYRIPAMETG